MVGLFMLLKTSSSIWNSSNLFLCHILNLNVQNFSSWLVPSVHMIEIENEGVQWTSQLFPIASSDSRLLSALFYFQLLSLLEFFCPILAPQQVSVSLLLFPNPTCAGCHLSSSVCQRPRLQLCGLSSCAIHCSSSWSVKSLSAASKFRWSTPRGPLGPVQASLDGCMASTQRKDMRSPFIFSQEKRDCCRPPQKDACQ